MLLSKILLNFLSLGKCLSINVRKVFATCVATVNIEKKKGGGGEGLKQVIFRFLVVFFHCFLVDVITNCRFVLYPFSYTVSVYEGHALLNT